MLRVCALRFCALLIAQHATSTPVAHKPFVRSTMPMELAAQVSESIVTWESIVWRRVVLGDGSRLDPRDVPDAQALAEDTLGGGMLRSSGPGNEFHYSG